MQKQLERKGIKKGLTSIAKVLRENDLIAKGGRKRKKKSAKKEELTHPNLNIIKNKFEVTKVNNLLCADICQIMCKTRWIYISGVIDAANRELVGHSLAEHMRKDIVLKAFKVANDKYQYKEGTVFHSDNGSQYLSKAVQKELKIKGIITSRSRPGKPMDNQPIESFWKTLKREIGDEIRDMPYNKARLLIMEYIMEYNWERLHSSIGYLSPIEARQTIFSEGASPFRETKEIKIFSI